MSLFLTSNANGSLVHDLVQKKAANLQRDPAMTSAGLDKIVNQAATLKSEKREKKNEYVPKNEAQN